MIGQRNYVLLVSSFWFIVRIQAGLYYDQKTCSGKCFSAYEVSRLIGLGDVALLDRAFASAFDLTDEALAVIGQPPPPGSAHLWNFPDSEARDLSGRIYGAADRAQSPRPPISLTDRLTLIKGTSRMTSVVWY